MSEKTNKAGTSGQEGPKSKFRQKSQQEQTAAAKLRMEKQGEKLDKAKEKLAKQKPPKQPGPLKRISRTAGWEAHAFVHGKLYEAEQDNVGVEGAHRSELVGETVFRQGKRTIQKKVREHPAKAVRKAERRHIKSTANYQFHVAAQEHPELEKSVLARCRQKRHIQKQYAKQAREAAKQGAKAAEKTAVTTERIATRTVAFVKRHPVGVVLALSCYLLIFTLQSCMSSMVTIGNGVIGAVAASTYQSEDVEILAAEAAYCGLEAELQEYLDTYEATHDYDEYHFDLDEIKHDPYVLISMLSALHEGAWTVNEVQDTIQALFDRQYILTETVVKEVRYRTETRTDSEGNSYTVQVPRLPLLARCRLRVLFP